MIHKQIIVTTAFEVKGFKDGIMQLQQKIKETSGRIKNNTTITKDYDLALGKIVKTTKKLTSNMKPFRMELLSVMFGAQMVSTAIWGLFQPALETVGVFELLSTALEVFFLPVVLGILDPLISLVTWFMELPEPIKIIIGSLLGVIAAFFTFLATEAALGLFFDGLINKVGKLKLALEELSTFGRGIGIVIAITGISELNKGNVFKGLSHIFEGFGLILQGKAGGALTAVGLVLSLTDVMKSGKMDLVTRLNQLFMAGYAGFMLGGWWGAGLALLLTIAIQAILFDREKIARDVEAFTQYLNNLINSMLGGIPKLALGLLGSKGQALSDIYFGGNIPSGGLGYSSAFPYSGGNTYHQSFSPSITVNSASNMDIERLKSQLNEDWSRQFASLSR